MASPIPIPANLPPTAALTSPEQPWPLRLLSAKIREYVEKMSRLWVEGEIITLQRRPGAKVQFFTLRDLEAQTAMTVKIMTHLLPETIASGDRVVICAKPDFYETNGSLSLWAIDIRAVGIGDILARLERLKNALASEGLFDNARKQALPFLPAAIGLICGRNTKAKEDVIVNAQARWPGAHFVICEVQVQGAGAVEAMLEALAALEADKVVDVIVFARGGGSVEDLLPFSDENLIRAVAAAHTPVVSAIGHEGDNPLLDFVADLRASTPTDAAKRIVPDMQEETASISYARERIRALLAQHLEYQRSILADIRARPVMAHPETLISMRQEDLTQLTRWIHVHTGHAIERERTDFLSLTSKLRALSPLSTLKRGYSILLNDSGIVTSASQTTANTSLTAVLAEGKIELTVRSTHE